jgi:chromosomal replication initiator protein
VPGVPEPLPETSPSAVWDAVVRELRDEVTDSTFHIWLQPLSAAACSGGTLFVRAPDHIRSWVEERFAGVIRQAAKRAGVASTVAVVDEEWEPAEKEPEPTRAARVTSDSDDAGQELNPRYTFEQFVICDGNRLGHGAALAVAEQPGQAYNPLFLHGPPGLGKTHLLHAIGNYVRVYGDGLRVRYATVDTFTSDFVKAVRSGNTREFRTRFRDADVLLVDDVQFLAQKLKTEEEFFHTFNALYEAQKQIVFTSDRPPKEIPTLEERLRSRFEWGLTADIQPPDLETKVAILRKKAEDKGMNIPQEVALFVAERVRSNVRELEGHLNKIVVYASLAGRTVTIDVAKEALKDVLSKEEKPITPSEILRVVAAHYGLKVTDLKQKSNAKTIAFPRQVAMYLCKDLTDLSYPEIGKLFGDKHHSTVMYSVQQIKKMMDADAQFARTVEGLAKQFR